MLRLIAIMLLLIGLGAAVYLLYQEHQKVLTGDKNLSLAQQSIIDLQRALGTCRQIGQDAKDGFAKQLASLTRKESDNKQTVASTPLARRLPAIRKNLVDGGFLPARYANDTSGRIRVTPNGVLIDIDTVEAAAIQESTGLVTIRKQAWDSLATGYAQMQSERDEARRERDNSRLASVKAEERFVRESQTRRFLGGFGYNARKKAALRGAAIVREVRLTGSSEAEESELERELNKK